MAAKQVVLDTNVFVSALRSSQDASFLLLSQVGRSTAFEINLSVPLVLEYEDVAKRQARSLGLTHEDVDDVLDYLCAEASRREIFFLWRPFLRDPSDDMVLELAVEAECEAILTYNQRDFAGVEQFGVRVLTPKAFLQEIGVLP
jgi:putative PIN family toxin of toxin-antitoxin system